MEMTGNTFPLRGNFRLALWDGIRIYEDVNINRKNTTKLQAKAECYYSSHASVIFEYVTGIEPTNEQIEWFNDIVNNGGLVEGKKIIRTDKDVIVRIAPAISNDTKRIIAVFGFNKKETGRTSLKNKIEIKGDIINTLITCSSRTGAHSTDFYVVVGYVDKCEITNECYRYTSRNNSYESKTRYNLLSERLDNEVEEIEE